MEQQFALHSTLGVARPLVVDVHEENMSAPDASATIPSQSASSDWCRTSPNIFFLNLMIPNFQEIFLIASQQKMMLGHQSMRQVMP